MSRIDVSIVPGGIPPTINVSQYDVGRDIDVKIDMGDLTISDSLTYLLEVKKPIGMSQTRQAPSRTAEPLSVLRQLSR